MKIGKIDKASAQEWMKTHDNVKEYPIDGIEKGFSFIMKKKPMSESILIEEYLIALTPGYEWERWGAFAYKPVVVTSSEGLGALQDERNKKINELVKLHKENIKNINNKNYGK